MKEELSNLATEWSEHLLHNQEGPISTSASRPQIYGILLSPQSIQWQARLLPTITCTF